MSRTLKRPMFRRGGFADTGIMEGFSNGGGVTDEQLGKGAGMPATFGAEDMLGLAREEAASAPAPTQPIFTRREAPDEPIMGLGDYASLFKLGAGIAGAPGRGDGLGGLLASASDPLQTAADEFAASQRSKAERKRAFEEKEDVRQDTFEAEQRQREAGRQDLAEEYRLKTELEKFKSDLDIPDIQLRMNAAKPVREELAALKAKKGAIAGDPVAMKDLLLEIRAKQNEISEIMGTAITVGDLSDEKSDDIRKDAKRDALDDIKSKYAEFEKKDIEPGGKYYQEYNTSLKAYEQFYIVEYLLLVTEGATMATGGSVKRVGLANGGGPYEPGSGPDPDPGSPPIMQGDSPMLSFEELRARLPREVSDQVVRLIATSENALLDFANIDTQEDIAIFNQKYNVDLQLPAQVV
jgi:hypothetical protein